MKLLPILPLLVLTLSACAPAQTNAFLDTVLPNANLASTYTPQNPTWVFRQFFLDAAARTQACSDGFAAAAAGAPRLSAGEVTLSSTEGRVTFQNAARTTAEVCRALALKGNTRPDTVAPQGVNTFSDFKTYPEKPLILLAFYDASGQETTRVPVLNAVNANRIFSRPVPNYAAEYAVNLPEGVFTLTQKTALASAVSFAVLIDFGKGIETLKFTQDRF